MTPNETIRNLVRILEQFVTFPPAPVSEAAGEDDLAELESWSLGMNALKERAQALIFEAEEQPAGEEIPVGDQLTELVRYARQRGYAQAAESVSLLRQDMEDHGAFVVTPPDAA